MAFNLPSAQYLMRSNSSINRGSFDNAFQNGLKTGGNCPIIFSGTQVQNGGGNEGIYFGLDSQNSTSSKDASVNTKVMLTSVQFNAPNRIQVGSKAQRGVVARVTSGSGGGNYREFIIGGNDSPFASSQAGPVTICIDLSSTSNDSSGGSYDNSNATGWGFGTFKFNLAGGASNLCFFQRVFLFDTGKGEPNLPTFTGNSNFDEVVSLVLGNDYTDKIGLWSTKSGTSIFLPIPFSIGDGVNPTNFNDNGLSINSPLDNAFNQENFRLTNDAMRVYLNTIDGDSVILTGSYSWGTSANWDFDISNTSTCDLSGNFVGMGDFTLGSSVKAGGNFNLASGSSVICNGANIDTINVQGDVKILGDSVIDFSGLTITGDLDFDTAGTYTLTGCNVNNITNSSSGNVVINNIASILSTDNAGTGAGQVDIISLSSITFNNIEIGSDIVIKDPAIESDGSDNNVVQRFSDVATTSITWNYTSAPPIVNIEFYKIGFKQSKSKGITTGGNQSINVSQTIDNTYTP